MSETYQCQAYHLPDTYSYLYKKAIHLYFCTCRQLGLKPKRTLRLVLWTDEEAGGVGSLQYYHAHQYEADNYSILMESDEGVFTPYGMRFHGSDNAKTVCIQLLWNLSLYQDTSELRTPL